MKKKVAIYMRRMKKKLLFMTMAGILTLSNISSTKVMAANPIKLVVNGKDITNLSSPIIENDRTLVPIRFMSEELGAKVTWNDNARTVLVENGNDSVLLRIGNNLVEYNNGADYQISDVAAKIFKDRTYVPLRLVSNALNIGVDWDDTQRTVDVDSNKEAVPTELSDVKILSQTPGQAIEGKTKLQLGSTEKYMTEGNEVKFLLLDPATAKGFIIARGKDINGSYDFMPKIEDAGNKILAGAIYDKNGKFVAGDSIPVSINVNPKVNVSGIYDGQVINKNAAIKADLNFFAHYIKYEISNLDNGKVTLTEEMDPLGSYNWSPMLSSNGAYSIRILAYDSNNKEYASQPVVVDVDVERSLVLSGVTAGSTVNKAVTLIAERNFDVSSTEYLMKDVNTGEEKTIAKLPYGGYKWFPAPEDSGTKDLIVRVIAAGVVYDSEPIRVTVDGSPKLLLQGVGPRQVITGETKISLSSNVKVDSVNYIMIKDGTRKVFASNMAVTDEFNYTPVKADEGNVIIQAEGMYNGKKISTEQVQVKVFLGQTFGPKPIIEKDKYLGFASNLAKEYYKKSGMSAALQTAQSILETGWGQSVPVDKYTGKLSNNLFGIKGAGPAGSVISNTWEVYNGVTYRVDADFRAYNSPELSWADHKEFLNKDRYSEFRSVMFDYSQGAWALKRAGYATDPQYALKLMQLIKQYNLDELDKVGI